VNAWYLPAAASGGLAAASFVRIQFVDESRTSLVSYQLRFPRDLDSSDVARFISGWSGSLPPAWKRWATGVPPLVLEARAQGESITHHLLVPRRWAQLAESLLEAHLPSVRYRRESELVLLGLTHATEYRTSTSKRSFSMDAAALSVGLLSTMQPLKRDERVVVQFVLGPHAPVPPPEVRNGQSKPWWQSDPALVDSSEAATALRKKQTGALLVGVGRIGVRTKSDKRALALLRRVEASWHATRAPGVHLSRRLLLKRTVARHMNRRQIPAFAWAGGALNANEAAGFSGWPIGIAQLPGLQLGGCRLLPVPQPIPRAGLVIGKGTFPSTHRPVALDGSALTRHLYINGPTGTGKSVFLSNLAIAHLRDPQSSLLLVDPKDGSLVSAVLEAMPENRLQDLIVFDPTDPVPVGFNPLACTPESRELVVDRIVSIMSSIWKSAFGPRSADLVRHALLALTLIPGMTLVEAVRLLTDVPFAHWVTSQVDDPLVTGAWFSWWFSLSEAERANIAAAPSNKLRAITSRAAARHAVGQDAPAIDFDQILNNHGVLLVQLPVGLLGEDTAALLGAIIIAQISQAIAARASIEPAKRTPALLVVDELATVLHQQGDAIETMLSTARGYGVGLALATQHVGQMPLSVKTTVLANTLTKILLGCSREDANLFAKEFGIGLTADELREIEPHEAVAAIFAAGRTQPPTTITVPPPPTKLRAAEIGKDISRRRFGVNREDIEESIKRRQRVTGRMASDTIGRKRRGSA
jgi:hypothetical protein